MLVLWGYKVESTFFSTIFALKNKDISRDLSCHEVKWPPPLVF